MLLKQIMGQECRSRTIGAAGFCISRCKIQLRGTYNLWGYFGQMECSGISSKLLHLRSPDLGSLQANVKKESCNSTGCLGPTRRFFWVQEKAISGGKVHLP